MTGGSGGPSVTNIDLFTPGYGPGTLLLFFRTSFSFEEECDKPRALCPNNLAKKKGEPRPIFKFVFFTIFLLLDSQNYKKRYLGAFRGVENSKSVTCWACWRPLGGATGDLWKPFGASSGSHGVLESSIEYKPVILVVRSRSKTLRPGKT